VRISANPTYSFRALAALGAVGITVLGAAPMAVASVNPNADAIVSQAIDGTPDITDRPAPDFSLVDQNGRHVTLARLRGKVLAVTFLDPVCTSDCPIIAQEFRQADAMLGASASHVEFIAVVANPIYRSVAVTRAFDRAEGLDHLSNWLYLTGSVTQLERTWDDYGVQVAVEPAGAMIAHSDLAYVIDATGRTRYVLDADPGPGSSTTRSSFAGVLTGAIQRVLPAS
jgi:cytochrome oxidase Cu insertion factor (SCO1/SenC/PrrC family)